MTDHILLIRAVAPAALPQILRADALPEGWPIPISAGDAQIIAPVFRFVRENHRLHRLAALNTVVAYSEDLKDWWQYLAIFGLDWREANIEHVARYRDAMIGTVSPATGKPYKTATIRRRCGTVKRFYTWARKAGLFTGIVDWGQHTAASRPVDSDELAHLRTSFKSGRGGIVPLTKGDDDFNVRVISFTDLELIRAQLGPFPGDGVQEPSRDRLQLEVMIDSGARIREVEGIWVKDIENLRIDGLDDWRRVSLWLTRKTKGGKRRKIPLFVRTVKALCAYIEGERRGAVLRAVDASKARGTGYLEPRELFVNGTSSKAYVGRPFRAHRFWEIFNAAVVEAGLCIHCLLTDPETREQSMRMVAKFHPHDLRHTFAVNEYHSRRRSGEAEPWKAIQEILGHENLATTLKIYLRVCREMEEAVSDASYYLFRAMVTRNNG